MMRQVLGLSKGLGAQTKRWAEGGWRWALGAGRLGAASDSVSVQASGSCFTGWRCRLEKCEDAGVEVKPRGCRSSSFGPVAL